MQKADPLTMGKSNPPTEQTLNPIRQLVVTVKTKVPLLHYCEDFAIQVIVVHSLHGCLGALITLLSCQFAYHLLIL